MDPRPPTRRALLLGAAAMALGGCGVRLEDDAPRIPLVPTREPVADEAYLLGLVHELRDLARRARTEAGADGPAVAGTHTDQADTLAAALRAQRVPQASLTAGPTTAGGSSASAPAVPLAEAELAPLTRPQAVAGLTTDLGAQVRSILVYRAVVGARLGGRLPWPSDRDTAAASTAPPGGGATPQTAGTGSATAPNQAPDSGGSRSVAADVVLLQALREAAYLLEVAAARSGPGPAKGQVGIPERAPQAELLEDVRWAQGWVRELTEVLGPATPAPPLGYPLPSLPTNAAGAATLARQAFAQLELSAGRALSSGAATGLRPIRVVTETVQRGARWGLPLRTFPGLVDPQVPIEAPSASATASATPAPTPT